MLGHTATAGPADALPHEKRASDKTPSLLRKAAADSMCSVETPTVFPGIPLSITAPQSGHEKNTPCDVMLLSAALHEAAI